MIIPLALLYKDARSAIKVQQNICLPYGTRKIISIDKYQDKVTAFVNVSLALLMQF